MTRRVCHCIASLHTGGAGRLLLSNLGPLRDEGFEPSVVYLVPRHDLLPGFTAAGWRVECLGHRGARHAPRTLARLRRHLRRERSDLIHTHLWLDRLYGGLAARLARRPMVTTLHAAGPPGGAGGEGGPRAAVEDLLARWTTDRFVAVSGAARDYYVGARGIPSERVETIHSGVPVDEIAAAEPSAAERAAERAALALDPDGPVLLHVGRLSPEKGQETLVAALPRIARVHPGATLLLAGDGGDRSRLEAIVARHGVASRVRFLGRRRDVFRLLHLADLFLFAPAPGEGLGLAMLEAMAAARPVVALRTPALAEILEDGAGGRLVEASGSDGSEALARAACAVLALPDRGRSLGRRGREMVRERFDARRSAARLAALYRSVLAGELVASRPEEEA